MSQPLISPQCPNPLDNLVPQAFWQSVDHVTSPQRWQLIMSQMGSWLKQGQSDSLMLAFGIQIQRADLAFHLVVELEGATVYIFPVYDTKKSNLQRKENAASRQNAAAGKITRKGRKTNRNGRQWCRERECQQKVFQWFLSVMYFLGPLLQGHD